MTDRDEIIHVIYCSNDETLVLAAWEKLRSMDEEEDNDTIFWLIIAAKRNESLAHEKVREQAWKDMLKRGIRNIELTLYYLAVNAPEPFNYKARKLLDKHLAKNKPS